MPQLDAFIDERFPTDIAFGSTGGPQRNTEIITLGSGREQRNQRWAHSRRTFNAGYGVKDIGSLEKVVSLFEQCRGPLIGFRYRDAMDYKSSNLAASPTSSDQLLGSGDGQTESFQLIKKYGDDAQAYVRNITKPVPGSVTIAIDGVELNEGSDWSVDTSTGVVRLAETHIPATNASITAGFEFDVPVRFDIDVLEVNLEAFNAGSVPSISLVEILQ